MLSGGEALDVALLARRSNAACARDFFAVDYTNDADRPTEGLGDMIVKGATLASAVAVAMSTLVAYSYVQTEVELDLELKDAPSSSPPPPPRSLTLDDVRAAVARETEAWSSPLRSDARRVAVVWSRRALAAARSVLDGAPDATEPVDEFGDAFVVDDAVFEQCRRNAAAARDALSPNDARAFASRVDVRAAFADRKSVV